MRVENARRLTGPSVFGPPGPCAAIEWYGPPAERAALFEELRAVVERAAPALGLGPLTVLAREHDDALGATLTLAATGAHGLPGPIDHLYAMVDWLEWLSLELASPTPSAVSLAVSLAETASAKWDELLALHPPRPALIALEAAAHAHGAPFLWDDDEVSLGWGTSCQVWPALTFTSDSSMIEQLDFGAFRRIPVALVTGTNGKTTTTRMLARVLRHAGHVVGASSTDGVTVAEQLVEAGDWSGPGAARKVLRRLEITAAVLETARGGILRRGLGVSVDDGVDAALVTNIGADHFGEYGVSTLATMAEVKAVVWRVVRPGGACVVNVDDPTLAAFVTASPGHPAHGRAPWALLSLDPEHPLLTALRPDHRVWTVRDGWLLTAFGPDELALLPVADIPATFGGRATHNIYNALGAAALAFAMGVPPATIAAALATFGRVPSDNPGRLEHHPLGGVHLLLDFGHNAHGVHAIADAVRALVAATPGARLFVSLGQAGDRSDEDIAALAREVYALDPHAAYSRPVHGYERGREPMDVPRLLQCRFAELGLDPAHNHLADGEVAVIEAALGAARPGDVILMLVHIEREAVRLWLEGQNSGK